MNSRLALGGPCSCLRCLHRLLLLPDNIFFLRRDGQFEAQMWQKNWTSANLAQFSCYGEFWTCFWVLNYPSLVSPVHHDPGGAGAVPEAGNISKIRHLYLPKRADTGEFGLFFPLSPKFNTNSVGTNA